MRSHHQMKTKIEAAKNFYKSAKESSSNKKYEEESYKKVDHLLRCNGYSNPRDMSNSHLNVVPGPLKDSSSVCLKTTIHLGANFNKNPQVY